ncbi:DUF4339 domain-containing protein [Lacipirellula parvula]|uniref:GYF domain-containing protein n=1 Tax=Lacipirellula parvula TaxID=2650471 RepID=A0A5K7X887_9BACT|nr:DUF4339 domain-containing protein [Lacipirellula parvula]BBO32027.1 hypothetical protein PLANPX_1639 [Lacipirellula parvula]
MGVRFECPAGHKLHVKAELAGKRGICPECGVKFIVPSFSGQRVPEDNGPPEGTTATVSGPGATSSTATPPIAKTVPGAQPPPAAVETATWYIRPASGGQYGPADDATFAQWVTEGRVAADSWVWRDGWADWKAGGEALRDFKRRPAASASPTPAASDLFESNFDVEEPMPAIGVTTATAAAHIEPTSADARRAETRRRKQQVRMFSIVLSIVALVMLAALVFVLSRGGEEETPADEKKPAVAPPAATEPAAVQPAPEAAPVEPPVAGAVAE